MQDYLFFRGDRGADERGSTQMNQISYYCRPLRLIDEGYIKADIKETREFILDAEDFIKFIKKKLKENKICGKEMTESVRELSEENLKLYNFYLESLKNELEGLRIIQQRWDREFL